MGEVLWWLLQPSSLLLVLLLFGLLALRVGWQGGARLLLGLVVLLVLTVVVLPVPELLAGPLETEVPAPVALPERVDGILVLGGALEWRVALARDQLSVDGAAERLMAGAALAQRYPDARLVLTGVFADQIAHDFRAEPERQSFFFGPAFAGRQVVTLGEARSTYEDALVALERLQPAPGERWLLVTSALHMPRALGVFETLGWRVVPYPVDYRTTGQLRFLPDANVARVLAELDRTVREWGALTLYRRSGRIVEPAGRVEPRDL